jgi:N-ethylmaleimide reductase
MVPQTNLQLLSPLALGALSLRNRIVMAPMTRSRAGEGDAATALNATYYAQRACAGLVIAEASPISAEAQGYPRTPGIHSAAQVAGWRLVTDAVHAERGTVVLQLWHVGRISHPENRLPGTRSVSASALAPKARIFTPSGLHPVPVPHALERAEIAAVVADYARAARRALDAGFDGVEIHAANGYLIDQFLHDGSNQRDDEYGGSALNRCRLLFEVCDAVGAEVGRDRVGVRLAPFGVFNDAADSDPAALFAAAIGGLASRGLAYLHVINVEASGDRHAKAAAPVDVAKFTRARYPGALIVGGGYTPESAEAALQRGDADAIAFARLFIANPDLVERVRRGAPLAEPDRATFYTTGPAGYTDYPTLEAALARASAPEASCPSAA